MAIFSFSQFPGFKKKSPDKPILGYGDPSHDLKNRTQKVCRQHSDSSLKKTARQQDTKTYSRISSQNMRQELVRLFLGTKTLQEINLSHISKSGSEGISTYEINRLVIEEVLGGPAYLESALSIREITDHLHKARVNLSKSGMIGFNSGQKVWYPKNVKMRNLTEREEQYLKAKGIKSQGWVYIPDKLEAIKWLHREFSDDEFERFCCALLEYCNVTNVNITEKRKSGADGGLDGLGEYFIGEETVPVAFEAKRHALMSQVGSNICQKLAGAMMENGIRHGFIITTAKFSERAKQSVENMEKNNNYQIELIDQDRMAEIMICKKDSPHGFGLHRTDKKFIYMNEEILRKSVRR
jgi:hypothetical protein